LEISIPFRAEMGRRLARARVPLLVVAAVLAVGAAGVFVSRSAAFHARSVEVSGLSQLTRDAVVGRAGVSTSTNVVWLDEAAVERRLELDPWIAAADVRVAFPWTIEITVLERSPVAVAIDGDAGVVVAADGTPLGEPNGLRRLPRIELPIPAMSEDPVASARGAALALAAMPRELRARVASVSVLADHTLELRMDDGVVVRYGRAVEPGPKAQTLSGVLAWAEREGKRLALVNVVSPEAPAVELATEGP
jgi:cell division protein FtsQ